MKIFYFAINNFKCLSISRRCKPTEDQPTEVYSAETQNEPQTPNTFHNISVASIRAKIPTEAVFIYRWTCRIQCFIKSNRDTSENLVSEQAGKSQETAWGRNRKIKNGCQANVTTSFRHYVSRRSGSIWRELWTLTNYSLALRFPVLLQWLPTKFHVPSLIQANKKNLGTLLKLCSTKADISW